MTKQEFYKKIYVKITDAMKQCNEGNVIDMRLYKDNSYLDGIFTIFEVDSLYESVKDCESWWVDFYENIKGANTAEFVDIVLWSNEFDKIDYQPLFDKFDELSNVIDEAEKNRRKCLYELVAKIQENRFNGNPIKFADATTYPKFYNEWLDRYVTIVSAKVENDTLFFKEEDSSFWFNWETNGRLDFEAFTRILKNIVS
jgi:hypothetical protein